MRRKSVETANFIGLGWIDDGALTRFLVRNQIHVIVLQRIEMSNIHRAMMKTIDQR